MNFSVIVLFVLIGLIVFVGIVGLLTQIIANIWAREFCKELDYLFQKHLKRD